MPNTSPQTALTMARMQAELQAFISQGVPPQAMKVINWGQPCPQLLVAARSQAGNIYTLHFYLEGFPLKKPRITTGVMLLDYYGSQMRSASGHMHILDPIDNATQICHLSSNNWDPTQSLYRCYVRAVIWLNMYEEHKKTGKAIDAYLRHG